ncbi:MAG TPA: serine/threonine-protein kinase [Pseudomonadota bacterium]|nr:serine/threonine-protein kinase [Pseudomonadota bacterium]
MSHYKHREPAPSAEAFVMPKELHLSPSAYSSSISPYPDSDPRPLAATAATLAGNSLDEGPAAALEQTLDGVEFSKVSAQHVIDPFPVKDWDRYELIKLLGRGGMGAVYLARDRRLGRPVALKFLRNDDPHLTARFVQEARAQSRLSHPNICKVYETGEIEGKAYIAMEYIDGQSLDRVGKRLPLLEKVQLLRDVAQALHSAHELGIIHRDIKPANIMLTSPSSATSSGAVGPRAVLMDFGLARESGDAAGLTESGAVMGTPAYMSPEQARGEGRRLERRSDVYGLGAALYDLLVGTPPFVGDSAVRIILQVLTVDPVPPRLRDATIPEALELIVLKCLNKEPHQRYATAAELAADLDRFLLRQRVQARRLGFFERLYWKGRRNRPLAAAMLALVLVLIGSLGYGVRTAVQSARREALAQKRAALAQRLGQAVQDLEWLVRTAHMLPLHDIGPDRALLRTRMAEIEAEMRSFGSLSAGLDHYALGRGHLALAEWEPALRQLQAARAAGLDEPGLHYALGRVLGERYSQALSDARKSGDASYFQQRKRELDAEYLPAVLSHLSASRADKTVSGSFVAALLDFYQGRYAAALLHAGFAARATPWLYEARRLTGDVKLAQALDARDHGDYPLAESLFGEAMRGYEAASDIGRSDPQVYEAQAEAWIRQEEMALYRGQDPRPFFDQALAAAERAQAADPEGGAGQTKGAFAYVFMSRYAGSHGLPEAELERLITAQITAGRAAIAAHPQDAFAYEVTGLGYQTLAEQKVDRGSPVRDLVEESLSLLKTAIRLEPRSPWLLNDYGMSLAIAAVDQRNQKADPQPLLRQAIAMFEQAATLDPQYALPHNNRAAWLLELADWQSSHGQSPVEAITTATAAAERAIALNPKNPLAYGNAGQAQIKLATWQRQAGHDGRVAAEQATRLLLALLALDPGLTAAYRDVATAYALLAWHQSHLHLDSRAAQAQAYEYAHRCLRAEPAAADCQKLLTPLSN